MLVYQRVDSKAINTFTAPQTSASDTSSDSSDILRRGRTYDMFDTGILSAPMDFYHDDHSPSKSDLWLVVWNMAFIFPYILGRIIPTDQLTSIFFRGVGIPPTSDHRLEVKTHKNLICIFWPRQEAGREASTNKSREQTGFRWHWFFSCVPKVAPSIQGAALKVLKSDQDADGMLTVRWRPFLCQWVAKPNF